MLWNCPGFICELQINLVDRKELLIGALSCFFLEVHQRLGVEKTNLYLTTGDPRETLLCCCSDNDLKLAFGLYCIYVVSCGMYVLWKHTSRNRLFSKNALLFLVVIGMTFAHNYMLWVDSRSTYPDKNRNVTHHNNWKIFIVEWGVRKR